MSVIKFAFNFNKKYTKNMNLILCHTNGSF